MQEKIKNCPCCKVGLYLRDIKFVGIVAKKLRLYLCNHCGTSIGIKINQGRLTMKIIKVDFKKKEIIEEIEVETELELESPTDDQDEMPAAWTAV